MRRADNLPLADQRRMASVFSAKDRFVNPFGEGAPLRSTSFSNDEFQAAAQMRFGVRLTCLMSSTDLPLMSNNASTIDKFVDAFGSSIKKTFWGRGWRHDGKPQLVHERHLGVVPPGPNPKPWGYERHPEDLQGLVLRVHPGAPRPQPPLGKHSGAEQDHPRPPLGPAECR